jgi:hypothetical protein
VRRKSGKWRKKGSGGERKRRERCVSLRRLNVEERRLREDARWMMRTIWKISDLMARKEDLLEEGMMTMTENDDITDTKSHGEALIVMMKKGTDPSIDTVTATNDSNQITITCTGYSILHRPS